MVQNGVDMDSLLKAAEELDLPFNLTSYGDMYLLHIIGANDILEFTLVRE